MMHFLSLTIAQRLPTALCPAAVVTTPSIARSFANGMEYFNTFGGNPVAGTSCCSVSDAGRDRDVRAG